MEKYIEKKDKSRSKSKSKEKSSRKVEANKQVEVRISLTTEARGSAEDIDEGKPIFKVPILVVKHMNHLP
jgi:hypothetical protein